MTDPKMYLNSVDAMFNLFAIDPTLPNPETYKESVFRRPRMTKVNSLLNDQDQFDTSPTYQLEIFIRKSITESRSGKRFYYWMREE